MQSINHSESSMNAQEQLEINNYLRKQPEERNIAEIFKGLCSDQKYLPSRFFYNKRGSELFETITTLPEYYPTRTEKSILKEFAPEIIQKARYSTLIELGSGDCSKISILLDALPKDRIMSTTYYPVDISEAAIKKSIGILSENYSGLEIQGYLADFVHQMKEVPGEGKRLICFFGSTIGNLTQEQADIFLTDLKDRMQPGDSLLLGMDMVKDVEILEAAYNDAQGITKAFNRNILLAVNQVTGTRLIPEDFSHVAFYNQEENRMEMHLEAKKDMVVRSPEFPYSISIRAGETIHTENSHKYTPEYIYQIGAMNGWSLHEVYSDPDGWFSLVQLVSDQ